MASGSSGEVVHCPNCKEDVPKTLYCLNCGFPLYKEEQPKENKAEQPDTKQNLVAPDEDAVIVVDEPVEEVANPKVSPEPAPEPTPEPKPVEHIETPSSQAQVEPQIEVQPEKTPELLPVVVEEIKSVEVAPPVVEAPSTPEPNEVSREPLSKDAETSKNEAVESVEEYQEEPQSQVYVPDPLTKDLMENLARNIALKLKLVRLYRDGVVKEETFTKIFEEYSKEGKIWSSRREELLKKHTKDVEEIEEAYTNASEALELLEIKKSIGVVSELEYEAKAPGYRWDIDHFDYLVADKKNRIAYLEDVGDALSKDELKELKGLASLEYNTIDALQISNDETLSHVKESLYEAIKFLG